MDHPIRKIFSDSIVYSIGYFLNRLMPFLLMPVYTYYYSPGEYGLYSLVYSFWMFVVIFYLFGMETSFQKFFIEAKTDSQKKNIYSSTLLLILLMGVIFSTIVYFASPSISRLITSSPHNEGLIRIVAVLLLVDSIARIPMILLNSLQRSKLYTAINLIVMVVNVAANLIFIVVLKLGIEAIFYSYLISYVFLFIISFLSAGKYFEVKIDFAVVKKLVKFAGAFLLYGLFLMSMDIIDRFILEHFKGTEQVGIYSACYRIGVAMNLVILGFRTAWTPFFLKMKNDENNKEIFAKVFSYFCFAGLLVFLVLAFFVEDLIKIKVASFSLLDEKYWSGIVIIPYILLSYLFFGLYTNLNVASYFENKIQYLIISSAAGCVSNIIFNFILIPKYGITGAAISTLMSYVLMFFILYYFSQHTYRIPYDWKSIVIAAVLAGVLYTIKIYVSDFIYLSYFGLVLVKFLAVLVFVLFLYFSGYVKLPQNTAQN